MKQLFYTLGLAALCFVSSPVAAQTEKPKASSFKVWNFPQQALFFKENLNDDWFAKPSNEREWLAPAGLSRDVFIALDTRDVALAMRRGAFEPITHPTDTKRLSEAALENWKQGVRAEWLPPLELVVPIQMNREPPRSSYQIGLCAFERNEVRGLYMTDLNHEFWLYLEQSLPLPAKTLPLKPTDVLRPDFLKATPDGARSTVQIREFVRFRAPLPNGEFQKVRILLIHGELPSSLSLADFGYPGKITP